MINLEKYQVQLSMKNQEKNVYKSHLPISHIGPVNPGLHARQVPSTISQ